MPIARLGSMIRDLASAVRKMFSPDRAFGRSTLRVSLVDGTMLGAGAWSRQVAGVLNAGFEIVQGHGVWPGGRDAMPPLPSRFELSGEAQAAPRPEPGQFESPAGRLIFS